MEEAEQIYFNSRLRCSQTNGDYTNFNKHRHEISQIRHMVNEEKNKSQAKSDEKSFKSHSQNRKFTCQSKNIRANSAKTICRSKEILENEKENKNDDSNRKIHVDISMSRSLLSSSIPTVKISKKSSYPLTYRRDSNRDRDLHARTTCKIDEDKNHTTREENFNFKKTEFECPLDPARDNNRQSQQLFLSITNDKIRKHVHTNKTETDIRVKDKRKISSGGRLSLLQEEQNNKNLKIQSSPSISRIKELNLHLRPSLTAETENFTEIDPFLIPSHPRRHGPRGCVEEENRKIIKSSSKLKKFTRNHNLSIRLSRLSKNKSIFTNFIQKVSLFISYVLVGLVLGGVSQNRGGSGRGRDGSGVWLGFLANKFKKNFFFRKKKFIHFITCV